MRNISKEQVVERIRFENPWWQTGIVPNDIGLLNPRLYLELFLPLVEDWALKRAIVLMGPRRVGKTVMLLHTIDKLLKGGVDPKKIVFITIENPIYNSASLEELFKYAKEASGVADDKGWYIFFDEIQYLKDWELHLKAMVDSYRQDKFVVSGSAAAALKYSSNESGAGRFTDFLLPPLTFCEYINLKGLDHLLERSKIKWQDNNFEFYLSKNIKLLNTHFVDYINFGGYPEIMFSTAKQQDPGRFIRHDIIDKVLLRDLPSLYGIADTRELNSLFTSIAYNSGGEFSLQSLSENANVPKNTIKKYIEYLEAAFLISIVRRIDQGGKQFQRDNFFKIYLTNPSLRAALFAPLVATDDSMGSMVETAIFAQWMHRTAFVPYYARWKTGEVDLIGLDNKTTKPKWAVEIKWSNRPYSHGALLKNLNAFCLKNKLTEAIVTTIDKASAGQADEQMTEEAPRVKANGPKSKTTTYAVDYHFIPAAAYAYTVGKRAIEQKKI